MDDERSPVRLCYKQTPFFSSITICRSVEGGRCTVADLGKDPPESSEALHECLRGATDANIVHENAERAVLVCRFRHPPEELADAIRGRHTPGLRTVVFRRDQ